MKNITHQLLLILFCLFSYTATSQSISGNTNSEFSEMNLGFANVNIYKDGVLVANVLTDIDGNYNVKLDTGLYVCEIVYAGYEKIVKEVKVTTDEKADFSLIKDKRSKYSSFELSGRSIGGNSYTKSLASMYTVNMWGKSEESDSASLGKLTAGEINDFSNWNIWSDLTSGELRSYQSMWNFAPTDRYTIQLIDQNGLPLANAKVELLNDSEVIYTSRSDNTGKAELWGSLSFITVDIKPATSIKAYYNGKIERLDLVTKFNDGINTIVFKTECVQSQNIDIAIVVDATGSMQDEIDYLKFDINNVIFQSKEQSKTLNFRFANIFYRDHSDVYLTQTQDFTSVLSESVAYTNEHNADGGGDGPEAVEIALDSAINRLSWRNDTRAKILFLVLDASPHNTKEIQDKLRHLSHKASEKGIRIVPISGSGIKKDTEYLMRCMALATNGTYTFLTNHSSIGNTHIRPSFDNYQVEILNDLLVRVIKSYTYMPDCQHFIVDLGINLPELAVDFNEYTDSSYVNDSEPKSEKDSSKLEWKFYPNPTYGIVNIISNMEISKLIISDLSGKALEVIKDITPETVYTIDLSRYASGIYLIRYPIGKQWISGKIVLTR